MRRYFFLFSFFVLHSSFVQAQDVPKFSWDVGFDVRFDNREFEELRDTGVAVSQTLFSARVTPAIGLDWVNARGDGHHRVMAGGSFMLDMGSNPAPGRKIEALMFYHFDSPKYSVLVGRFERRHLIGAYSRAIYAGSSAFYDNVLDGFVLQHHPRWGYVELALDWDGMQTVEYRESFRVLSAGMWGNGAFRLGYSFDMYHLASRTGALDGVVDHVLFSPWVGFAGEKVLEWFERLSVEAGWMGSFDRDRMADGRWVTPMGATLDVTVQKWKVGVSNRMYVGERQMPLRGAYGNRIYKGDGLYSSGNFYDYLQIYWKPQLTKGVSLGFELGLHTDGKKVGWQQVAALSIAL